MRILHLNTHTSGGSYEYAALLCTSLEEQGIEGRLFSKSSQAPEARRPLLDRLIRRLYVSLSTEPWHGTRRLLCPPASEELDGIDVVHLHTVADWFDVPGWLETLPHRIGVVISVHDMWHISGGCFLYRGCDQYRDTCTPCPILKPPLNRLLAEDEHRRKLQAYQNHRVKFVANSRWLAGLAEQSPVVRTCGGARVISPGIDTTIFKPQDKMQCRRKLGLSEDAFVIVAGATSLTDKNKNVQWLLEQVAQLSDRENLVVLLAGEGMVQIPITLNVRFMGGIPDRSERAALFGAADVFVSASLMETYGLTLVEAMSCATPVVAFRVGGIPEAVADGKTGILCEQLDTVELQRALEDLRRSAPLRQQLGTAASKIVLGRNDKRQFAAGFVRVYEESLNATRTPSMGEEQKETKSTKDFVESYDQ
ncbi:MAG: glycosyltransferase [Alphaproteobacteria bacterium]